MSPSGVISVEHESFVEADDEAASPFFAKADELLQAALDEKADKTELDAKMQGTVIYKKELHEYGQDRPKCITT